MDLFTSAGNTRQGPPLRFCDVSVDVPSARLGFDSPPDVSPPVPPPRFSTNSVANSFPLHHSFSSTATYSNSDNHIKARDKPLESEQHAMHLAKNQLGSSPSSFVSMSFENDFVNTDLFNVMAPIRQRPTSAEKKRQHPKREVFVVANISNDSKLVSWLKLFFL